MKISLDKFVKIPAVGTPYSAGLDLACLGDYDIPPNHWANVKTGVRVEIPEGYFGLLCLRSSAGKRGLSLLNTIGIIDSDYRGEIIAMIRNNNTHPVLLSDGTKVAQLVVIPHLPLNNIETADTLTDTVRGVGGFGSTGV
jgi:dUTP pyrophosphatase